MHVIILDLYNVGLLSEVGMTTLGLPEEENCRKSVHSVLYFCDIQNRHSPYYSL